MVKNRYGIIKQTKRLNKTKRKYCRYIVIGRIYQDTPDEKRIKLTVGNNSRTI